MHVSEKGQVTIPIAIRRKYAILPDTDVQFVDEGDRIVLEIVDPKTPGQRLVEHLAGKITTGMTTDELMAMTRGED